MGHTGKQAGGTDISISNARIVKSVEREGQAGRRAPRKTGTRADRQTGIQADRHTGTQARRQVNLMITCFVARHERGIQGASRGGRVAADGVMGRRASQSARACASSELCSSVLDRSSGLPNPVTRRPLSVAPGEWQPAAELRWTTSSASRNWRQRPTDQSFPKGRRSLAGASLGPSPCRAPGRWRRMASTSARSARSSNGPLSRLQ